ncbi:Uncharacterised protein [Mycobacteroides abscessus subsp. abscessus]|nr:Uncharacterised protein [Mycobacteroides abscessus subsp. abscessus]
MHLFDPDEIPAVGITILVGNDVEIVVLVAAIRLGAP